MVAMKYLMVKWVLSAQDDPCVMHSELDEQRMERRKIEVYRDGRWGFADEREEVGGSGLGEALVPTVESLNADLEFEAEEIDEEEFEKMWNVRWSARIMAPFPLGEGSGEPS